MIDKIYKTGGSHGSACCWLWAFLVSINEAVEAREFASMGIVAY